MLRSNNLLLRFREFSLIFSILSHLYHIFTQQKKIATNYLIYILIRVYWSTNTTYIWTRQCLYLYLKQSQCTVWKCILPSSKSLNLKTKSFATSNVITIFINLAITALCIIQMYWRGWAVNNCWSFLVNERIANVYDTKIQNNVTISKWRQRRS